MVKLQVDRVFIDTFEKVKKNALAFSAFSALNFVFMAVGFGLFDGFSDPMFLWVMMLYYVFFICFFRFYFDRKPYFLMKRVWGSLVPSTKIFAISLVVLLILATLPFLPLAPMLLGGNIDVGRAEEYVRFLEVSMDKSKLMDWLSVILFVFVSPIIFYRPFMAWISSIVGRSGAIKTAFNKTKKNYWRFVLVGLIMHLPFVVLQQLDFYVNLGHFWIWLIVSPIVIYFNMVIARIYEIFFLKTIK